MSNSIHIFGSIRKGNLKDYGLTLVEDEHDNRFAVLKTDGGKELFAHFKDDCVDFFSENNEETHDALRETYNKKPFFFVYDGYGWEYCKTEEEWDEVYYDSLKYFKLTDNLPKKSNSTNNN